MNVANKTKVLLIGGTSHVGKSILGKALADRLGWNYVATDSLGKHPGRPWIGKKNKEIKEHVVQHYQILTVDALLSDVLSHYQKNILPQVEAIINDRPAYGKSLVIEGSALYPKFVYHLVEQKDISGIWLIASDRLLRDRILRQSHFYNVDEDAKYLITKFLARTLLYNQRLQKDVMYSGLEYINLNHNITTEKLVLRCLDFCRGNS